MAIVTRGKKFQALQRRLRRQNAAFKKLSLAQQRVKIAEDVILQLKLKLLKAESTYLRVRALDSVAEDTVGVDASCALAQANCDVCGIGSLFVTAVKRADKLPLHDLLAARSQGDERELAVEYLRKWFPSEMLDRVEDYYEQYTYDSASPILSENSDNERLKMIMENIISNKGKFDPFKGAHKTPR